MRTPFDAAFLVLAAGSMLAQAPGQWKDPSPHRVQFVDIEGGVRLETLDWGGRGRAVVLLARSGNSAHVFDEFACRCSTWRTP
jgi:hypothetical protein